jgi:hypothetical protein
MNQELSYAKLLDTVREAGGDVETMTAFAALVAAAERKSIVERCAYICEEEGQTYHYSFAPAKARIANMAATQCGTKIRNYFKIWYGIKETTDEMQVAAMQPVVEIDGVSRSQRIKDGA